ncbi:hypothetical protein [Pseudarthrobacter sp. PS3-L1]|uniref:hypothetical protein n=1 Tax=Pseudarthrobacter sp. PS3-L1 TaxID=3046207 RepID=UPI0024BA9FEC|nr:hypothetical protein [Pseudarthrobacter sp. PS3-L1]MDJ0321658.1 hypothetical protein [Pseudarthrobacter sp. PS3-L1]
MTARKAPAKDDTAPVKAGEPGPKPRHQVVEHTLKCQTTADGEISLSLLLPYARMKVLMAIEEQELSEIQMVDYMLQNVIPAPEATTLMGLQDGGDTLSFAMAWLEAVGARLGGQQGKSGPSSN